MKALPPRILPRLRLGILETWALCVFAARDLWRSEFVKFCRYMLTQMLAVLSFVFACAVFPWWAWLIVALLGVACLLYFIGAVCEEELPPADSHDDDRLSQP